MVHWTNSAHRTLDNLLLLEVNLISEFLRNSFSIQVLRCSHNIWLFCSTSGWSFNFFSSSWSTMPFTRQWVLKQALGICGVGWKSYFPIFNLCQLNYDFFSRIVCKTSHISKIDLKLFVFYMHLYLYSFIIKNCCYQLVVGRHWRIVFWNLTTVRHSMHPPTSSLSGIFWMFFTFTMGINFLTASPLKNLRINFDKFFFLLQHFYLQSYLRVLLLISNF